MPGIMVNRNLKECIVKKNLKILEEIIITSFQNKKKKVEISRKPIQRNSLRIYVLLKLKLSSYLLSTIVLFFFFCV